MTVRSKQPLQFRVTFTAFTLHSQMSFMMTNKKVGFLSKVSIRLSNKIGDRIFMINSNHTFRQIFLLPNFQSLKKSILSISIILVYLKFDVYYVRCVERAEAMLG